MIIGNFLYDREADRYRGSIHTLTLARASVELRPQTRANDREPDYRVVLALPEGDVELGAAWRRRSDRERDYLSVLLDDPSLDRALSAALFTDKEGKANLVWSRPPVRQPAQTEEPAPARGRMKRGMREPAHG